MINNQKVNALICEFNPLHLGHKYIIDKMKEESSLVVCLMSGNFVQRGDIAIFDKWARTKMALACGADLVLELPLPIATSGAKAFADGSIKILNSLGIIDNIYFGSESGNISSLQKIIEVIESESFNLRIKEEMKKGMTFAAARENCVNELLDGDYLNELSGSNNNLAIEYMTAIINNHSVITPKTIKRVGGAHDVNSKEPIVSAKQIREMISNSDLSFFEKMPMECAEIIKHEFISGAGPVFFSTLELSILCKLRTMTANEFSALPDISEGLHNKIFKAVRDATTIEELFSLIKSKRYTLARVRRLIFHAFLGITKEMQSASYVRILGMNNNGKEIIRNSKKNLPIIGKISDTEVLSNYARTQFNLECIADDIYNLCKPNRGKCGESLSHKIIIS